MFNYRNKDTRKKHCGKKIARGLTQLALLISSLFYLSACVSMKIEGTMDAKQDSIEEGKVTVLSHSYISGNETEKKFTRCVANRLSAKLPEDTFLDSKTFVNEMFPWFEPKRSPADITDLRELLKKPLVKEKLSSIDARYLIMLAGSTKDVEEKKCEACVIAPLLLGMPGMATFKKQSNYLVEIWDLKKQEIVADLNAKGKGKTYMPIIPVFVVPIPLGGNVQSASCKQLTQQLSVFFTGDEES